MFEVSDIPQIIETRIIQFAWSLPSDPKDRQRIIDRYALTKGYEFLNPKSKLYKHFLAKLSQAQSQKHSHSMEQEIRVKMVGNLEQISVGGLCEIVKQNMSEGNVPYTPLDNEVCQHEFSSVLDIPLFEKTAKMLHNVKLTQIQLKKAQQKEKQASIKPEKPSHRSELNKQMGIQDDGSLGSWGGNKYEGLGSRNEFTEFRKQHSQAYYQKLEASRRKS